jgi:hypothetical protein
LPDDWVMALEEGPDPGQSQPSTLFVGTYKGGVVQLDAERGTSTPLFGGWINPGGLHRDGARLYAATMKGALLWQPSGGAMRIGAGPGEDVTAVAPAGGRLAIATRRGLWLRALPRRRP